jgi:hypothetical protein
MDFLQPVITNWFTILSALGIAGGLFFNGYALRSDTKTRRVANLLILAEGHRDIWKEQLKYPELARVLDPRTNLTSQPVTMAEEVFVNLVIQHLNVVFHTMRNELTIKPEGLRRDVSGFFSLPIPAAIWSKLKVLQNDQFVKFVEDCRNWK